MGISKMFTPIKIGLMEVKNRFVVPAMGTNLAEHNGEAGEALISYYRERARGGFGLIIAECSAVSYEGRSLINECGLWEDSLIPSYRKLTDSVHESGAVQLRHCGRETKPAYTGGTEVLAPSKVPCPANQIMPHEISTGEVRKMVGTFGDAALRGKKAGFDAVELHASHGYLVAQFLSGHANKRTDEFGGSLFNRMRFLKLILRDIREKAGADFPVIIRISGTEMITGRREIQETKAVCQMCEEEGAAAIHVSISTYGSLQYCIGSTYLSPGYETAAAAEIKKSVNIPVITVGRYTDPEIAESVVWEGSADMVGEIKPDAVVVATGSRNLVPPIKGLDKAPVLNPCDVLLGKVVTGHKVLVAGGGLIGAETADFLAEQGREVTIIEMKPEIASDLDPYGRPMLLKELKSHEVVMLKNAAIQEFLPDGVTYKDTVREDASVQTLNGFDSVVLALGTRNYNLFADLIGNTVSEIYVIGDAKKAGKVYAATHEAAEVAMSM